MTGSKTNAYALLFIAILIIVKVLDSIFGL